MATKSPRNESAARRRKITKFALAGVAIVGVGAGLTSAAWSDSVWFASNAGTGSIALQGRVRAVETLPLYTPLAFDDGEETAKITIPAEAFGGLTPSDDLSVTLELYNDGDGVLTLLTPDIQAIGPLFADPGVDYHLSGFSVPTIAPGEAATFDVSITTPNWNESEGQNLTGSMVIEVQAST